MNVKELIEILEKCPQDLPIRFVGLGLEDEEDNRWIESIEVSGTGSSGYEIEGEVRLIEGGINSEPNYSDWSSTELADALLLNDAFVSSLNINNDSNVWEWDRCDLIEYANDFL